MILIWTSCVKARKLGKFAHPFCLLSSLVNLTVAVNCVHSAAMDDLGLKRYCCRRMVLTHVDLIQKLLNYNSKSILLIFPMVHGILIHLPIPFDFSHSYATSCCCCRQPIICVLPVQMSSLVVCFLPLKKVNDGVVGRLISHP